MTRRERDLRRLSHGDLDIMVSHGCHDPSDDTADRAPPLVVIGQGSYAEDAMEGAGVIFWAFASLVVAVIVGVALWLA